MTPWSALNGAAAAPGGGPDPQHPRGGDPLRHDHHRCRRTWRPPPGTISEQYGCAVLCKGGHQVNDADDLLWRDGAGKWFHGKRIDNPNTHGTGCTLSSAIASNLAKGYDLDESVERAKAYISGALAAMLDLGHGSGPMNHMFALKGAFTE